MRSVLATFAALVAMASFAGWGCSTKAPTSPATQTIASRSLSIRNAADVERVIKVQNANSARLMAIEGVIGTGTGALADGRPAVLVLAKHDGLAGVPDQIDGIAVETRVIGEVIPYAKPGGGGTLQCGTSVGNDLECAAGTIGCVVVRSGTKYFLSNNHVFARENAARNGERIDAPGRYDGKPRCAQTPICGTLADFQAISFSGNNTIDCAIALPDPGRPFTGAEAGGYTPSSTVVSPSVGLAVKKTGRTSGLTSGTIQAINVTIQVQYSGGVATFVNQIMTPGSFIRSGDSGSLMVTQSGNNPVGLCFAGGSGGSFANPIGPVLSRFNATVSP
jgi:hypothetical protein